MQLVVHNTPEELARATADRIASLIRGAGDAFSLGLAGGSTPAATYRRLAEESLELGHVQAWLSDERWVPPDDERSNGRMAAMTLIDRVGVTFHRPPWGAGMSPAESAAEYEAVLRSIHRAGPPHLVLLGLGEDGHTASLFPGTQALEMAERWFVANKVHQLGETRLTATYPLLWSARRLMVLAVGERKAEALKESLDGTTPAGRLMEGEAEVEWHVDTAAASLIS
ncbi:MAG: 6-phosphogluconolactonase [Acidimicrobiia bacterium]